MAVTSILFLALVGASASMLTLGCKETSSPAQPPTNPHGASKDGQGASKADPASLDNVDTSTAVPARKSKGRSALAVTSSRDDGGAVVPRPQAMQVALGKVNALSAKHPWRGPDGVSVWYRLEVRGDQMIGEVHGPGVVLMTWSANLDALGSTASAGRIDSGALHVAIPCRASQGRPLPHCWTLTGRPSRKSSGFPIELVADDMIEREMVKAVNEVLRRVN